MRRRKAADGGASWPIGAVLALLALALAPGTTAASNSTATNSSTSANALSPSAESADGAQ